jgi:hypothetical protein
VLFIKKWFKVSSTFKDLGEIIMSELTLADAIKPVVSFSTYKRRATTYTSKDPQELSSSDGRAPIKEHNVLMGWHRNTADNIDGVFLRMLSRNFVHVCTVGNAPQEDYVWTTVSRYIAPPKDFISLKRVPQQESIFNILTSLFQSHLGRTLPPIQSKR